MATVDPPQNPAGEFVPPGDYSELHKRSFIECIERFPADLDTSVAGLDSSQLDTKYRNWTIRQIVHHLADSHLNSYVRFKWALTEETPTIKSYNESLWSEVIDATDAPIDSSLALLGGLHARWGQLITRMTAQQWTRGFFHPEMDRIVTLKEALPMYAWHSAHHLAQIVWVKHQRAW